VRARLKGVVGALVVWGRVTYHHEARLLPAIHQEDEVEALLDHPQLQKYPVANITPEQGWMWVGVEGVVRDGVSRLLVVPIGCVGDIQLSVGCQTPGWGWWVRVPWGYEEGKSVGVFEGGGWLAAAGGAGW